MSKAKNTWTVVIPKYLTHIQLSKARRATYYSKKDLAIGGIPKKYLKDGIEFNSKGRAINALSKEIIIKNSRSAGTPKLWKINGQDLWSGNLHHATRSKMNEQLHDFFAGFIEKQIQKEQKTLEINLKKNERLHIHYLFRDVIGQDIDNLAAIYVKTFQDTLSKSKDKKYRHIKKVGLIPDDNPKYIKSYMPEFEEINDHNKRELIITITKIKIKPLCQKK